MRIWPRFVVIAAQSEREDFIAHLSRDAAEEGAIGLVMVMICEFLGKWRFRPFEPGVAINDISAQQKTLKLSCILRTSSSLALSLSRRIEGVKV
jgi:hypothetical protein